MEVIFRRKLRVNAMSPGMMRLLHEALKINKEWLKIHVHQ